MLAMLDFDRSRQLNQWIETNHERILSVTKHTVKQVPGNGYSELACEALQKFAVANLYFGGMSTKEADSYVMILEYAISYGITFNEVVNLSKSFYLAMETLARSDWRLNESQRKFVSDRICYVSTLVATSLTTAYLKQLVATKKVPAEKTAV